MVTQLVTVDAVIMNIGRRASTPQHPASTLNWHSRASPLGICQGFPARLPLWGTGGLHGHLGPSPSGLLPMALFQLLWVFGMSILVKFIVFSSPILALLPPLPLRPMARLCWGTVRPDIPNFHQSLGPVSCLMGAAWKSPQKCGNGKVPPSNANYNMLIPTANILEKIPSSIASLGS